MTRKLNAERAGPERGKNLVIFVHGYGANGADLIGLADPLAPHMPETIFYAPDAPDRVPGAPFGFQWFPIPWLDGSSQEAAEKGLAAAADDLNHFITDTMEREGIGPENTILFGFSQGTMLSLHIAPRRDKAIAGVVGFSGRLLSPDGLGEAAHKPPILLVHGDADGVVPFQSMPEAADTLQKAGFDIYTHVMAGTGHGIAPDGLSVALSFMRDRLNLQN